MKRILLATNNPGKLREISAILQVLQLDLLRPADLGLSLEVEENGTSYSQNALLKALAFAAASGLPVLADDSGLEVEALGGQPGIHSHRFNPKPGASDADRCDYLVEKLMSHPQPWKARFVCHAVFLVPGEEPVFFEGFCPGQIVPLPRGNNGFGYDPIMQIEGLEETMAQLPDWVKNRISHRAQAFNTAVPLLAEFCL